MSIAIAWSMFLLRFGSILGYVIKYGSIIIGGFSMFGGLKTVKVTIVLIVIAIMIGLGGYGYMQHKLYSEAKADIASSEQELLETIEFYDYVVEERNKEIKLIQKDLEFRNTELAKLSEKKEFYMWQTRTLNKKITNLVDQLKAAETTEELNETKQEISDTIVNSYNCIMKASGNTGVVCNEESE